MKIFLVISVLIFLTTKSFTQPATGNTENSKCSSRKTTDPGRLNIDTSTKRFGLEPCELFIDFYIAQNTQLRSVKGKAVLLDSDGEILSEKVFNSQLKDTDSGMFKNKVALRSITGENCQELTLVLNSIECKGDENSVIECPDVRLKKSNALQDLIINKGGLNICFDS